MAIAWNRCIILSSYRQQIIRDTAIFGCNKSIHRNTYNIDMDKE